MRFSGSKSQLMQFTSIRERNRPPVAPILLGDMVLALVPTYRYLGLLYDERLTWRAHIDIILTNARRRAALISRVIRSTSPGVVAVRLLILSFLIPTITYGLPLWTIRKSSHAAFNSIISAPLRRVLFLPPSTHRLSVLADCGVPDILTLCDKSVIDLGRRLSRLDADHPSAVIFTSRSFHSFSDRLDAVLAAWSLTTNTSTAQVRRAATIAQMKKWRAASFCRDLLAARPLSSVGFASHYHFDPPVVASIRARLRLNRSYLNDSQYRRGLLSSAACSCEHGDETIGHLLVCAHYDHLRSSFRCLPYFFKINVRFLLGEVFRVRSIHRESALHVGACFLHAVYELRPNGI